MYIYELENWPQFFWNQEKIAELLSTVRYQQGRLMGGMESIGFHLRNESFLDTLAQDVVKSSEIEGEILDLSLVRSSVARHLGLDHAATSRIDKHVEGVVDMMLDATLHFQKAVTKSRLLQWHSDLFPYGRSGFTSLRVGKWRKTSVQVISKLGYRDHEQVHFEGPPAEFVDKEMSAFLNWCNEDGAIDPVIKAALAHLWFVTIHPFDDGNGRIARAIGDLFLARSENSSQRFYSLSAQIQKERKGYYTILEQTQKGNLNITPWIQWFLRCLSRAIESAITTLKQIGYKALYWESITKVSLNERQRKLINILLDNFEGNLTTSKWAKIAQCSQDTAYRDILELINLKILVKNAEGGRSTSYSLKPLSSSIENEK